TERYNEIYTPTTLLGVYTNTLNTSADGEIILTRGHNGIPNAKEYYGYYYETLRSPNPNHYIKIRVSNILRGKLNDNKIYLLKGYMEKRMNSSSIKLMYLLQRENET